MKRLNFAAFTAALLAVSLAPAVAQNMPGMDMPAPKPAPKPTPKPAPTPTPKPAPQPDRTITAPAQTVPSTPAEQVPAPAPQMEMPMPPPASVRLSPQRNDSVGAGLDAAPGGSGRTLPNLRPKAGWPSPVADNMKRSFLLFDLLEYRPRRDETDVRWDITGWRGTDEKRLWFKTEGQQNTAFKTGREFDAQLLYGKLVRPFYDLQYGIRFEQQSSGRGRSEERVFAVVGFQGLAPYRFETEAALFLSHQGDVSARFTATKDFLLSQKLILQGRFETEAALQEVERFGVGSGLNYAELGFRLRYEIKREFAPYIGVSYQKSFGQTASFVRQDGGEPSQLRFVAGVRMWF